jgi:hypothetical protein
MLKPLLRICCILLLKQPWTKKVHIRVHRCTLVTSMTRLAMAQGESQANRVLNSHVAVDVSKLSMEERTRLMHAAGSCPF